LPEAFVIISTRQHAQSTIDDMVRMFRSFRSVTPAMVALLISGSLSSAKAEFNICNVASGLVVDVIGAHTNDLQGVILFPKNNGKNQLFEQAVETDNSFALVAQHSSKCLDVDGGSQADNTPIIQFKCHFGPNQRWTSQRVGRGVILRSVNSGKCLDSSNGNFPRPPNSDAVMQQFTCIANEAAPNAVNQIFQLGGC
jgi:hypothetical protein